jgi:hypothetical protein
MLIYSVHFIGYEKTVDVEPSLFSCFLRVDGLY